MSDSGALSFQVKGLWCQITAGESCVNFHTYGLGPHFTYQLTLRNLKPEFLLVEF